MNEINVIREICTPTSKGFDVREVIFDGEPMEPREVILSLLDRMERKVAIPWTYNVTETGAMHLTIISD